MPQADEPVSRVYADGGASYGGGDHGHGFVGGHRTTTGHAGPVRNLPVAGHSGPAQDPYALSYYEAAPQGGSEKNTLGLASMVLGYVGIVVWPAAITGMVMGLVAFRNLKKGVANNRVQTMTGVILGIVMSVVGFFTTLFGVIVIVVMTIGGGAAAIRETGGLDLVGGVFTSV